MLIKTLFCWNKLDANVHYFGAVLTLFVYRIYPEAREALPPTLKLYTLKGLNIILFCTVTINVHLQKEKLINL